MNRIFSPAACLKVAQFLLPGIENESENIRKIKEIYTLYFIITNNKIILKFGWVKFYGTSLPSIVTQDSMKTVPLNYHKLNGYMKYNCCMESKYDVCPELQANMGCNYVRTQ